MDQTKIRESCLKNYSGITTSLLKLAEIQNKLKSILEMDNPTTSDLFEINHVNNRLQLLLEDFEIEDSPEEDF
jgi:hypothetical protein